MNKKEFLIYIFILLLTCISAVIVWPTRWINLDIGSFHYHKEWKGPDLEDLTRGRYEKNLDIDLGKDFEGGMKYKVKVGFTEEEQDKLGRVRETVDALRTRLHAVGQYESTVRYIREGVEYFIEMEVTGSDADFDMYKIVLLQKGNLEVWGERGEDQLGDQQLNLDGGEVDPFRAYIEQNYMSMGVDGNDMKGLKVDEEDDNYYVRVSLSDNQVTQLTSQIQVFYGKAIVGILDNQILFIDGADLGEQIQYYSEVKSIKMSGMIDKDQAKLTAAVMETGPLQVDLEIVETNVPETGYGREFLNKAMVSGIIVVVCISLLAIFVYRADSFVFIISTALYGIYLIAGLNLFSIRITMGSVLAFILSFAVYIGFTFKTLNYLLKEEKGAKESWIFVKDKKVSKLLSDFLTVFMISGGLVFLSAPWIVSNFIAMIVLNIILTFIIIENFIPFFYKFCSIIRR